MSAFGVKWTFARDGLRSRFMGPRLAGLPRGYEFAHGVARLVPSGDSIRDDFYGGRSHLNELYVANHLLLNSLRLGFEKVFCFLQLPN